MAEPLNATATTVDLQRLASNGAIAALLAVVGVAVVAGRLLDVGDVAFAETFVLIFTSITVEALPFVLLGALVSAVIEVYVPERIFGRISALPAPLQIPGAALGGFAFPVCECGSVPVARRLIARGLHPAAGLTFMLASPILNPIVLASTYVAYAGRRFGWEMLAGRAILGLVLAGAAGWALGGQRASELLRPHPEDVPTELTHDSDYSSLPRRLLDHLAGDFLFMARFVVIGAALAAALQTTIPQDLISGVARSPVIGSLALMGLAYVMSLCSEADAFVAVSLVQFPVGAQLAFLVFGPVVDAKLSFLYGGTFRKRFVSKLIVLAVPVVVAGSLWFEVMFR
jgi:uncharacterized membrane protein YraQ (UPF0718 family)